jgi:hypothetical protein
MNSWPEESGFKNSHSVAVVAVVGVAAYGAYPREECSGPHTRGVLLAKLYKKPADNAS